jgi:hypothetical protein
MPSIEEISYTFQQIAKYKQGITLLNAYKGIPISSPATIIEWVETAINLQADKRQFVCISHDNETLIQSPLLPVTVRAKVLQVNVKKVQAAMTDFTVVDGTIGVRTQIRVSPETTIKALVKVQDQDKTFKGEIVDISLTGMGIHISDRIVYPATFHKGVVLVLSFLLPGIYKLFSTSDLSSISDPKNRPSNSSLRINPIQAYASTDGKNQAPTSQMRQINSPELKIKGTIVNMHPEPFFNRYRIGLHLTPEEPGRSLLSQFISQRQAEIIRELKDAYEQLLINS